MVDDSIPIQALGSGAIPVLLERIKMLEEALRPFAESKDNLSKFYGGYDAGYNCPFCGGYALHPRNFEHESDCPIRRADAALKGDAAK